MVYRVLRAFQSTSAALSKREDHPQVHQQERSRKLRLLASGAQKTPTTLGSEAYLSPQNLQKGSQQLFRWFLKFWGFGSRGCLCFDSHTRTKQACLGLVVSVPPPRNGGPESLAKETLGQHTSRVAGAVVAWSTFEGSCRVALRVP